MKTIKIIERATGEVAKEYNKSNVKFHTSPEDIEAMRQDEDHALIYFLLELVGLNCSLAMWEVDKYDLVIC